MSKNNSNTTLLTIFLSIAFLFSIQAEAQESGGIGGAVSGVAGKSPVQLAERVLRAIADGRKEDALALMSGKALSDFNRMLSSPDAQMERIMPQDWRILGSGKREDDSERHVLVQLKIGGEWGALWLSWKRIENEWKFTDSVLSSGEDEFFMLSRPAGQISGEKEVRSTIDSFITELRAMNVAGIRSHLVGESLEKFDEDVGSEDFSEELSEFSSGLTYRVNNVRIPPAKPHLAIVNYDMSVAGQDQTDEYMLLLQSGGIWRILDMEYDPDSFEDNLLETADEGNMVELGLDDFAAGSMEREVFVGFDKVMKAFVAMDVQAMLDYTTGEAREDFVDLLGDDDAMAEYRQYAPTYRWRVIDIAVDPSDANAARVVVMHLIGDKDWDNGEVLMRKVGGVWKMAETD